MAIREFTCEEHGIFEKYIAGSSIEPHPCPTCRKLAEIVEYSTPAKRNPEHGLQK